jgi:alkylation response protein AidB-like acyl-CoA dehydrogenase
VAPRAAGYDEEGVFPAADFDDLRREGLLLATLSRELGGLGYQFSGNDPLPFFLIIERLARGSASTAHCFQVHSNGLQLLERFGSPEQVQRFIEPTRTQGMAFVGAAAEPGGTRDGTRARRVQGGYLVTGMKHYATNATHSKWMIVFVKAEDTQQLQPLAVDTASEGLTIDASFYRAAGMRACVSPMLVFKDCFVPDSCVLGISGAYLQEHWPARINLGFTANYIGTVDAMLEWAVNHMRRYVPVSNAVYLSHIGELRARLDAARLLFYHAVSLTRKDRAAGLLKGTEAKWIAVDLVTRCIDLVGQCVGSTAMFSQFPLERMIRDMQQHSLHRRHHPGAVVVAQHELGQDYDLNQS